MVTATRLTFTDVELVQRIPIGFRNAASAQANMWWTRVFLLVLLTLATAHSFLYPRESPSRDVRSLDGIWNFRVSPPDDLMLGHRETWYSASLDQTGDVIPMPVPASYNDITQDKAIRDYVGVAWYDRTFYVPDTWQSDSLDVWLRFGSVHYAADVYVNGELVTSHEIGHLPFQTNITGVLNYGAKNRVTVAVSNVLNQATVPQGSLKTIQTDNGTKTIQSYTFDFFNYAGIHRPVVLYTTPRVYIDDITIDTRIDGSTGIVRFNVSYGGETNDIPSCSVSLLNRGNEVVGNTDGLHGEIIVKNARFWWPYLMDPSPGYLYTLQVRLSAGGDFPEDVYELPVGIRTVEWDNRSVLINGKSAYIRGFGRHEDSDIRGKGLDHALVTRDYNLIKWIGANAYRTSHYPYAEEIMDMADKVGIMIIDECPGVNIEKFSPELLETHKDSLTQLIQRDKNRPSVIMWSVANEARTKQSGADDYFSAIADHVRSLDTSRPITMAINVAVKDDLAGQFMDIISFNKYNAWYVNPGQLDTITKNVIEEAQDWHDKHNKPVLMTEYGADTMAGLHRSPEYIWSEEYQTRLLSRHFVAFDELRERGFFLGEMVWNFADFNTEQAYTRVAGNKKGIFTRSRQPKAAAHLLRRRYWALAEELDNATVPQDVYSYISRRVRDEL